MVVRGMLPDDWKVENQLIKSRRHSIYKSDSNNQQNKNTVESTHDRGNKKRISEFEDRPSEITK